MSSKDILKRRLQKMSSKGVLKRLSKNVLKGRPQKTKKKDVLKRYLKDIIKNILKRPSKNILVLKNIFKTSILVKTILNFPQKCADKMPSKDILKRISTRCPQKISSRLSKRCP